MAREFKIRYFEKFDDDLEKIWTDLEENSDITFFQTYKWQKYWHKECGANVKIIIVLIYENNKLISILPFNIKKKIIFKILNWNGFPFSDYNKPIIRKNYFFNNEDYKNIFLNIRNNYSFNAIHFVNNIDKNFIKNKNFKNNISYKLKLSNLTSFQLLYDRLRKK